jgi:hypothetical protein
MKRRRKTTKTSVRRTYLGAEVWTRHLPNMKHEQYPLNCGIKVPNIEGRWLVNITLWPPYPRGKIIDTHWVGGCLVLRLGLEAMILKKLKKSVALVRYRTMPIERPPLVGEVVPTFADRRVLRGQRNGSPQSLVSAFLTGAATISSK